MASTGDRPTNPRKQRLEERVRNACRLRHYSIRTEEAYWMWVRQFILHHHERHPDEMGTEEVTAFLSYLAVERNVAASTRLSRNDADEQTATTQRTRRESSLTRTTTLEKADQK